ncbi:hypothetical protein EYA84_03235 [Verrucosispora sp. SN26_14.1]|uniref:hypothetical protein n=1 Tax=Verrucosispora sp. SN26_14.1 TaxID=2527879 RepID=UPI001033B84F|nr:hypothetical protein [Verrucosispora sp. SN26_14.1]TBL42794.1 hypothetical protein EYA84_03235 [Verrucosispora sp. SN26_14.1]
MAVHAMTTAQRTAASLTAALMVLAGLTSCTPAIRAVTGLTSAADGRPLAALAWCADRPPDVVVLRLAGDLASPSPSAAPAPSVNWPEWWYDVPQRDATSPATVELTGFPPSPGPDLGTVFQMRVLTRNNSFTSHDVSFRLPELADLRPGSVLITTIVANEEVQKTVSLDEFARLGRNAC